MTNRKHSPAIRPLRRAKEAHAKNTADQRRRQEQHRQDLDDPQRSAILMRRSRNLRGLGRHLQIHLCICINQQTAIKRDQCSQTSASR